MNSFLQYFEAELDYVRRALNEFEDAQPQKAQALKISAGRSTDPDLQRLTDSFALVSARLQKRLDDARPEIALDILRMCCPSVLLGAPSYAALALDPSTAPEGVHRLARGTEATFGSDTKVQSTFSVARDVDCRPLRVRDFRLDQAPFAYNPPESDIATEAALCIQIETQDGESPILPLLAGNVELYLPSSSGLRGRLCDALAGDVRAMRIARPGARDGNELPLAAFGPSLAKTPGSYLPEFLQQLPGLERLRDFLAYPDKGYFFTFSDLNQAFSDPDATGIEIRLFLGGQTAVNLGQVHAADVMLNVVPCINLFEVASEPLRYRFARGRMPVTPREPKGETVEVLRIDTVKELTPEEDRPLPSITAPRHRAAKSSIFWQERQDAGAFDVGRKDISLSTPRDNGSQPSQLDFVGDLLCSNGSAGSVPRPSDLAALDSDALADAAFRLLDEPTAAVAPESDASRQWDLIALINGNFGAVLESSTPTDALRETVHLIAPSSYSDAADAIWDVTLSNSIAPLRIGGNVLMASGTEVEVVLNLDVLPHPPAVFAHVLNDFFASLVSYDRFIRLKVRARGHDAPIIAFDRQHGSQKCA